MRRYQDKALILIGFAGGFRRSELVDIDYEDLDFVPEGVKIFVKRSKTDQSGEGMIKAIPYFDSENYCPVKSLSFQRVDSCEIKKDLGILNDRMFAFWGDAFESIKSVEDDKYDKIFVDLNDDQFCIDLATKNMDSLVRILKPNGVITTQVGSQDTFMILKNLKIENY